MSHSPPKSDFQALDGGARTERGLQKVITSGPLALLVSGDVDVDLHICGKEIRKALRAGQP
jgi:hypothetical protein